MLTRYEEIEVEAIMYIHGLRHEVETLPESNEIYGNFCGAAVNAALVHKDLEGVQRFLGFVRVGYYADKLFTSHHMTPEIMVYMLQNKPISEFARNVALRIAVSINNSDTVKLLLAQPDVHVLHPEHRVLPLVQQATFNIQPELVRLLVQNLVENSMINQRQAVLSEALLLLADNDAFYRELLDGVQEEKESNASRAEKNLQKVLEIAEILIKNGANINARDAKGSVIQHAQQRRHLGPFVAYLKLQQPAVSSGTSAASLFGRALGECQISPQHLSPPHIVSIPKPGTNL